MKKKLFRSNTHSKQIQNTTTEQMGSERRWRVLVFVAALAVALRLAFVYVHTNYDEIFVRAGVYCSKLLPEFNHAETPPELNYSDDSLDAWVGHPLKEDNADFVPPCDYEELADEQHKAKADVFYVYPTGYFGFRWNAPATHDFVSDMLARTTLMVHASIFNGVGRIYAPYYRQMTGFGFLADEEHPGLRSDKQRAIDLAYSDVRKSFMVFLEKWNQERPIFLVGHSQGSHMLFKLIEEFFGPETELRKRLVAGYLVGIDLHYSDLKSTISVCEQSRDTGCVVGYNVFLEGGDSSKFVISKTPQDLVCVNPLTWTVTDRAVNESLNLGSRPIRPLGFLPSFDEMAVVGKLEAGRFKAHCREGVLWTNSEISLLEYACGVFPGGNYHGIESSLFWLNTRKNAADRWESFQAMSTVS